MGSSSITSTGGNGVSMTSTSGNGVTMTSTNGNGVSSMSSSSMNSSSGTATGTSKTFNLAGISPENVNISVSGNTVRVQAVQMNGNSTSTCNYSFNLPAGVDKSTLDSEFLNGVLTFKWAKPSETPATPTKMNINF